MTNVFTTYMTTEEARHALHIVEAAHARRLLIRHLQHVSPRRGAILFDDSVVYAGAYVRSVAECEQCFPALTAARLPRTRTIAETIIDEQSFPALFVAEDPGESRSDASDETRSNASEED